MKKGFTLIELLVVVLIIGILAAIALPQYTKAVERSRSAEAVQALGDLATAQSIYYMQNNEFTALDSNKEMPGDVTIKVPSDSTTWEFSVLPTTTATDKAPVVLKAKRKNGMYKDQELQLTVENTGAISKCASQTDGFKDLAKTAGYDKAC